MKLMKSSNSKGRNRYGNYISQAPTAKEDSEEYKVFIPHNIGMLRVSSFIGCHSSPESTLTSAYYKTY